ncbi:hypothetical protein CORT_0A12360 [Candida orthopsilosis Co 90-125]|uniref:Uncharacterized protein n=1 Tax=Candida orthopsilosis (strain 90-125) TaxID=1136231 RepID=H8WYY9_CANO9|nr:hypothetical protein CORT_0A12360 [Candida orthopsilosis Co 90-125]CCG21621.1 hypothetical protein CORT_0A12360 [Candida orthopsilosis Co 90-125]
MRGFYPGYRPHHFGFGGLFIVFGAFILGRMTANPHGPTYWRHQRCGYSHHSTCQCPDCVKYQQYRKEQELSSLNYHQ